MDLEKILALISLILGWWFTIEQIRKLKAERKKLNLETKKLELEIKKTRRGG